MVLIRPSPSRSSRPLGSPKKGNSHRHASDDDSHGTGTSSQKKRDYTKRYEALKRRRLLVNENIVEETLAEQREKIRKRERSRLSYQKRKLLPLTPEQIEKKRLSRVKQNENRKKRRQQNRLSVVFKTVIDHRVKGGDQQISGDNDLYSIFGVKGGDQQISGDNDLYSIFNIDDPENSSSKHNLTLSSENVSKQNVMVPTAIRSNKRVRGLSTTTVCETIPIAKKSEANEVTVLGVRRKAPVNNYPPTSLSRKKTKKSPFSPPGPKAPKSTIDLTESLPGVRAKTAIEVSDSPPPPEQRKVVHLSVGGLSDSASIRLCPRPVPNESEMAGCFYVPQLFFEETDLLLCGLSNKNKNLMDGRRQEGVQLIVSSNGRDEPFLLKGSISSHDMEELLTPTNYLTDSLIEYYRCLLMREELKRAQSYRANWKPCFVHTTLFMTVLSDRVGGRKNLGYSFDHAIRHQDRGLIGK